VTVTIEVYPVHVISFCEPSALNAGYFKYLWTDYRKIRECEFDLDLSRASNLQ